MTTSSLTQLSGRRAPFKRVQRWLDMLVLAALVYTVVFAASGSLTWLMWLSAGYIACTALDAIVSCGDRVLAEQFGYQCRDCGQRYSPEGMQPMLSQQFNHRPREPR